MQLRVSRDSTTFSAGVLEFDGLDPQLGRHMLSLAYWSWENHSLPTVHRLAFLCATWHAPVPTSQMPFSLDEFRVRFGNLLHLELSHGPRSSLEIATIQDLLVITAMFTLGDRGETVQYVYIAFEMIQSVNSRYPHTKLFSGGDLEIWKCVFWSGMFWTDCSRSTYVT